MASIPSHVQTEDKRFVRDTHSKALLNQDMDALRRHRLARVRAAENVRLQQEVSALTSMCQKLETRLNEMVALLEHAATASQR